MRLFDDDPRDKSKQWDEKAGMRQMHFIGCVEETLVPAVVDTLGSVYGIVEGEDGR